MKSEVTRSRAGDLSRRASVLKESTQDYANGSALLGGVSAVQHQHMKGEKNPLHILYRQLLNQMQRGERSFLGKLIS